MIRTFRVLFLVMIFSTGCATSLITAPVDLSDGQLELVLQSLTAGPDQYNTAGGYWRPREGTRFLWATFMIRNNQNTPRMVHLKALHLLSGGRRVRPFIIDMGSAVTMRANPDPRLGPGESLTRRIVFRIPVGEVPEKIAYEGRETSLSVMRGGRQLINNEARTDTGVSR